MNRRTAAPSSSRSRRDGSTAASERAEPTWARAALIALLVCTAAAYLWDLKASGDANSFYAAAVQAGTKSWKAMFFGSIDSSNFITVDKPPASLWVMEISGRIFGFSSLSMLVPQVLEGVAAREQGGALAPRLHLAQPQLVARMSTTCPPLQQKQRRAGAKTSLTRPGNRDDISRFKRLN